MAFHPDLPLLRAFVAVAEEPSVASAAQRLNITQSPLSRQVQRLEADLGFLLFHRVRRRLVLTAEGRQFLAHARTLLAQADALGAAARRLKQGQEMPLNLGYVQAALHSGLLSSALRQWTGSDGEGGDGGGVRLRLLRSHEQAAALIRGDIDLALVHTLPEEPGFSHRTLSNDPVQLAVPAGHRCTARGAPTPADLEAMPWIALDRALNPAFRLRFLDACRAYGFQPDIRYETADVPTALALVSAGLGAVVLHRGATRWGVPDGVALYPLPGFGISLVTHALWRPDALSAAAARFLALLPWVEEQPGSGP